ncbi:MAG TPA: hypothetical protein VF006_19480 [Longimicrobium sp.]
METDPLDPYENDLPSDSPDPPPSTEPGWWDVIGGAWRWVVNPTPSE